MKPTPEELKRGIEALSPANKLRLAADMIEAKQPRFALAVAERALLELKKHPKR